MGGPPQTAASMCLPRWQAGSPPPSPQGRPLSLSITVQVIFLYVAYIHIYVYIHEKNLTQSDKLYSFCLLPIMAIETTGLLSSFKNLSVVLSLHLFFEF